MRGLTDTAGALTDSFTYDGFGVLINRTGTTPNLYLYAGEQYDPELGLYYNRARYLNAGTGRFWSQDSWEGDTGTPVSLNKYLYADINPINNSDPSGHSSLALELGALDLRLTINSMSVLQVTSAIGIGILGGKYLTRPWTINLVSTTENGFHMFIFAEDTRENAGWRYDIGFDNSFTMGRANARPFSSFDGIIFKSWNATSEVTGVKIPIAKLSDNLHSLWDAYVFGVPDVIDEDGNGVKPYRYRRYPGPNCTTWSLWAASRAFGISLLPF